jgi:hypothetical protein
MTDYYNILDQESFEELEEKTKNQIYLYYEKHRWSLQALMVAYNISEHVLKRVLEEKGIIFKKVTKKRKLEEALDKYFKEKNLTLDFV